MARPVVNVDDEYAQIEIAGVWYDIKDVQALIERLTGIMEDRDWLEKKTVDNVYVDLGIMDDTIVYELSLKVLARIPGGTSLDKIMKLLQHNDIRNVLVDPHNPREVDMMREAGFNAQRIILKTKENKR